MEEKVYFEFLQIAVGNRSGQGTGQCTVQGTEVRKRTVFGETAIAINDQQLDEKNYISTDDKDVGPQADDGEGQTRQDMRSSQIINIRYGAYVPVRVIPI